MTTTGWVAIAAYIVAVPFCWRAVERVSKRVQADAGREHAQDQAIALTKPPAPSLPRSAAPGPHGDPIATVLVHACGYTITYNHLKHTRRDHAGYCHDAHEWDAWLRELAD